MEENKEIQTELNQENTELIEKSGDVIVAQTFGDKFKAFVSKKKADFNVAMRKYDDLPKPLRKNKYKFIFCMLFLSIVMWAVFYVYKNISSILMAFQEFMGYGPNGEEIYVWSFRQFEKFWEEMTYTGYATQSFKAALKNTLFLYVFGNMVAIPSQHIISYYLYKKISGYRAFRTIFYLPSILSSVVMVTIFKNMVDANGLISAISIAFGGKAVTGLLTTDALAKYTVWIYNCWVGLPGSYILLTAAMNRIPQSVVESCKLDGCGVLREYWSITVPMIWPTLYILIIQKITGILSADGPILLLTGGANDTFTIGYWFYNQVILSHSFEYPSAIGLIMTAVIAPISIVARKLLDKVYADVEY